MIVQGVAGLTVKMTFWVLPGATLPGMGMGMGMRMRIGRGRCEVRGVVWCVKVVFVKIIDGAEYI